VATVLIEVPPSSQASQDAVSQNETLATIEHNEMTAAPSRYRIQAVERVGAILDVFTPEIPELGVTEIAERTGLHKSTVHRFLVNLEAVGLLERDARTQRYRLGLRMFEMGGIVLEQMSLWDEALPFLEGLVTDSGETGHLAVLERGEAIYIEKVEARRALRIPSAMGRGYPAHATSLGKVLLSDLGENEVREILGTHGMASYTRTTTTDVTPLLAELADIRERGFAVDDEEYDEGLRCVGAPIRDHTGRVVAALGIGGPVTRVTPERVDDLARLVIDAADGLSRRLGASQSGAYTRAARRVRATTPSSPSTPSTPRPSAALRASR
jgi:DNA-binding IclR family transcriptional regulator